MFKFLKQKQLEKDFEKDVTLYLSQNEDKVYLKAKIEGNINDAYICNFEFIDNDLLIKFYSTHVYDARILMKHCPESARSIECWVLEDKKFE